MQAATDLIWSPMFRKFPDMRLALSEGGIGWIPYFLERIDYQYQQHHTWTGQDFGDRLPSEVFDEHVLTCFIDDRFGVASRNFLNMDNVMWECDYPHSDSTWPFSPEELAGHLEGVNDHDVDRMSHPTPCATLPTTPSRFLVGGRTAPLVRCGPRLQVTTSPSGRPSRRRPQPARCVQWIWAPTCQDSRRSPLSRASGADDHVVRHALRFAQPALAGTSMAQRYDAALDIVEWADRLGCVSIAISEHHGSDDGYLPSPSR